MDAEQSAAVESAPEAQTLTRSRANPSRAAEISPTRVRFLRFRISGRPPRNHPRHREQNEGRFHCGANGASAGRQGIKRR